MLRVNPKPSEISSIINSNNDAEHIETTDPMYHTLADLGSHFGSICLIYSRSGAFVANLFFGTSGGGGTPWTDVGLPWDTLGLIFLTYWRKLKSNIDPNVQDSRATNGANHTFKNTNNNDSRQVYRQSMHTIMFYFCCSKTSRKSEAPGLNQNRVGGTREGTTI